VSRWGDGNDARLSTLDGTGAFRRARSSSGLSPSRPTRRTDLTITIVRSENVSATTNSYVNKKLACITLRKDAFQSSTHDVLDAEGLGLMDRPDVGTELASGRRTSDAYGYADLHMQR
jgi:hypothetical protein